MLYNHQVIIPLRPVDVWYAVIVDLQNKKYDIVCSHIGDENIQEEANLVIKNFKLAFEDAHTLPYKESYKNMPTTTIQWISDDVNEYVLLNKNTSETLFC